MAEHLTARPMRRGALNDSSETGVTYAAHCRKVGLALYAHTF